MAKSPYIPKKTAYNGKMITIDDEVYSLIPERNSTSCLGCEFLNKRCTPDQTAYCTQGYIFKKLNFSNDRKK